MLKETDVRFRVLTPIETKGCRDGTRQSRRAVGASGTLFSKRAREATQRRALKVSKVLTRSGQVTVAGCRDRAGLNIDLKDLFLSRLTSKVLVCWASTCASGGQDLNRGPLKGGPGL